MKMENNYHKREQSVSWLVAHINTLLQEAKEHNNSSFVLYAAFETRNLIEKVEYDILVMSLGQSHREELENIAKGKMGLRKSNNLYKILRYKYQTFSSSLCTVFGLSTNVFDYKTAELYNESLSECLHTYTKNSQDIIFSEKFIQDSIKTIADAIAFIKNYFIEKNGNNTFGIINFSTLKGEFKIAFEEWKADSSSQDTDALYKKLKKINDEKFGGKGVQQIN